MCDPCSGKIDPMGTIDKGSEDNKKFQTSQSKSFKKGFLKSLST